VISKPLNFSLSQAEGDLSNPECCVQCGPNAGDLPDREKKKNKVNSVTCHNGVIYTFGLGSTHI